MVVLSGQAHPVLSALNLYSWLAIFFIYFISALACGFICGKIAEAAGMSVSGYVFLGTFTTSLGLTVTFIRGVNPYFGLLFGFIGIAITTVVFISSRQKVEPMELPRAPSYSPFETPIGYGDSYMNQLSAPNQPPPEEYEHGSIVCPNCNVSVPADYSICWNCGELMKRQSISRLCPTCHHEMPAEAQVCGNCGSSLDGPAFNKQ